MIRAVVLALAMASPAPAQEIVAALSQSNVSIDYSFSGSEIMVFGAVRGGPPGADHDVIVTVSGPLVPITVRRKERVAGIWVNAESAEIDQAPSFYAVATTGPFEEVLTRTEDLRHAVSVPKAIRAVGSGAQDPGAFVEALVRIRRAEGIYATAEGAVTLRDGTLFDTAIALPPDLVEGDYETRILLTEEGRVVAVEKAVLAVRKVGLERFLYGLAHDSPVLYGTLSLVIAVAAGWGASTAFRLMRS